MCEVLGDRFRSISQGGMTGISVTKRTRVTHGDGDRRPTPSRRSAASRGGQRHPRASVRQVTFLAAFATESYTAPQSHAEAHWDEAALRPPTIRRLW